MDGIAALAIWFASIIGGMLLTMIMPQLFTHTRGNDVAQYGNVCEPSHEIVQADCFQERRASMVLIEGKE